MHKLERIINCRRKLAHSYNALFENDGILNPATSEQSFHVYQSYIVLLPAEMASERTRVIAELKNLGIETNIGTWHMPMTTYFRTRYGYKTGDFEVTDDVFARSLSLPLYETLTYENQLFVVKNLLHCVGK